MNANIDDSMAAMDVATPHRRNWVLPGLVGLVLGVVLTGVAVWQAMPGMMIVEHQSKYGVDETVSRLQQAIKDAGWVSPGVRDMNKSMSKQGVVFDKKVRLVELCHADHAKSVLGSDRHVATLMPCAIAVYEGDDGKTYISGMNMGLMGKMFGGNIAAVMGGPVAEDERKILSTVIQN